MDEIFVSVDRKEFVLLVSSLKQATDAAEEAKARMERLIGLNPLVKELDIIAGDLLAMTTTLQEVLDNSRR
jgi:hypothetical protein